MKKPEIYSYFSLWDKRAINVCRHSEPAIAVYSTHVNGTLPKYIVEQAQGYLVELDKVNSCLRFADDVSVEDENTMRCLVASTKLWALTHETDPMRILLEITLCKLMLRTLKTRHLDLIIEAHVLRQQYEALDYETELSKALGK